MTEELLASHVSEDQLIGQAMMTPEEVIFQSTESGITPEWFSQLEAQKTYAVLLDMYLNGHPISLPAVMEKITEKRLKVQVDYLQGCVDLTPVHTLSPIIGKLKEYHMRREMLVRARNLKTLARTLEVPPEESIGKEICGLADLTVTHQRMSLEQIKKAIIDRYRAVANGGTAGLPTPWPTLNKYIGGLVPKRVTIFGGRTSLGKSMASANLAYHLAKSNIPVGYLTFEDGVEVTWARIGGMNGKYSTYMMDTQPRPDQVSYAEQHIEEVMKYPIFMEDRPMKIEQIRAWAIHQHVRNDIKLLIIDAFKDIRKEERSTSEEDEISQSITEIARSLNIPVWVSHHIRKAGTDNRRDKLTGDDIKGSSNITADCRQLILLQNWTENDVMKFSFEIVKNSNGPAGMSIPMERKSNINTWEELKVDTKSESGEY
jgi:replicative DNA helicase